MGLDPLFTTVLLWNLHIKDLVHLWNISNNHFLLMRKVWVSYQKWDGGRNRFYRFSFSTPFSNHYLFINFWYRAMMRISLESKYQECFFFILTLKFWNKIEKYIFLSKLEFKEKSKFVNHQLLQPQMSIIFVYKKLKIGKISVIWKVLKHQSQTLQK